MGKSEKNIHLKEQHTWLGLIELSKSETSIYFHFLIFVTQHKSSPLSLLQSEDCMECHTHIVTDRELTVLPAKLIKTNDVYVLFPVLCRHGSVQIRSFIVMELYFTGII